MKRTITIFLDLRKLFVLVFFFNSIFVLAQTTHNITNPEQLTAAFSATLGAGDTVILWNVFIRCEG